MIIITNQKHIIHSISLIEGINDYPYGWSIYDLKLDVYLNLSLKEGDYFNPANKPDFSKSDDAFKKAVLNNPNILIDEVSFKLGYEQNIS